MSGIIDLIEWRRLREAPEGELQRREHAPGMPEPDPRGVARLDRAAERLYELVSRALEATGRLQDCTLIISSDHGLWINDHSYLLSEQEKYTPLIFLGPRVRRCRLEGKPSIMDINANVSYLLGLRYNEHSRGRVYPEAFARPALSCGEQGEAKQVSSRSLA